MTMSKFTNPDYTYRRTVYVLRGPGGRKVVGEHESRALAWQAAYKLHTPWDFDIRPIHKFTRVQHRPCVVCGPTGYEMVHPSEPPPPAVSGTKRDFKPGTWELTDEAKARRVVHPESQGQWSLKDVK